VLYKSAKQPFLQSLKHFVKIQRHSRSYRVTHQISLRLNALEIKETTEYVSMCSYQ